MARQNVSRQLRPVVHRLRRAEKDINAHVRASLEKYRDNTEKKAKQLAPKRSGRLADNVVVNLIPGPKVRAKASAGGNWSVEITTKKRVKGAAQINKQFGTQNRESTLILPKRAGALTLPLGFIQRRLDKAEQISARVLRERPSLLGFSSTFVGKGEGRGIIFGRKGKKVTPLWSLRSSAVVRGNKFADRAMKAHLPQLSRALARSLASLVGKRSRG